MLFYIIGIVTFGYLFLFSQTYQDVEISIFADELIENVKFDKICKHGNYCIYKPFVMNLSKKEYLKNEYNIGDLNYKINRLLNDIKANIHYQIINEYYVDVSDYLIIKTKYYKYLKNIYIK